MVRVRIAPSPTGIPHIGNTRTALYNYLFAKKNKGKFIVRIEDTDKKRLVAGATDKILEILKLLNLQWDEKPYIQSERLPIYKKWAETLIKNGKAYYCFCSKERLEKIRTEQKQKKQIPHYDKHCLTLTKKEIPQRLKDGQDYVVRLKVSQNQKIQWEDLVQGKIEIKTNTIDDQVLIKADGYPTYHLAATIDDHLMEISHVIRGVEWLSSTPKHIILYQAFGWKLPLFAHLPLILGPDKTKLSKRHGAKSALDYKDEGYLPEAIINFMVFLGWSYKDNSDLLSLEELIKIFDMARVRRANPIFDINKLNWFNGAWIRKLSDKELVLRLKPYLKIKICDEKLIKIVPLLKERITKLNEADELLKFINKIPDDHQLLFKGERAKEELKNVMKVLKMLDKWQAKEIYQSLKKICEEGGYQKKEFYVNLYVAVEGKPCGLPLFESMEILGKNEVLLRLNTALNKLK